MSGDIKRIVYSCIIIAFIGIVGFMAYQWVFVKETPKPTPTTSPKQEVQVKQKDTSKTTIAYVPKRNAQDNDVEITTSHKPIKVSVNGKTHEVKGDVKETHKLDNGKLVVTEERDIELNLKVPEQPRFKKGVYIDTDQVVGVRASYQTKDFDIDVTADVWSRKHKDKEIRVMATKWL